jgi:hypothetical protein
VLLEHVACANFNRYCDWTPLQYVSYYGRDIDAVQLLLEYGAEVGCRTDIGHSPLHLASGVGCPLEYDADFIMIKRMCSGLSPLPLHCRCKLLNNRRTGASPFLDDASKNGMV